MATEFGLTSAGFVAKQQSDIKSELEVALQAALGQSLNLLPESVFGQLVGIFSEREALVWQLAEAVYDSQYPSGAEGTSVDNILALNNLRRLAATPTKTDPTPLVQSNNTTLYGLVLLGTPGTVVPAGSTIKTTLVPAATFDLDSDVTIGSAADDVQSIFFSNTPDSGAFALHPGASGTTPSIPYSALANQTKLVWGTNPTSGQFKLTLTLPSGALVTGFIQYNDNATTVQNAIRALTGYSGVTCAGSLTTSGMTITWGAIPNPIVTVTNSTLDHPATVTDSVQAAINSIAAWVPVTVTGSFAAGFVLTFTGSIGSTSTPLTTVSSTTLQNGATVTNIRVDHTTEGHPAQGIGTATCEVDGPTAAPAGSMTVIGSPVAGWASVTNQLDALPGTNLETDTEALQRRTQELAAQANGPIQAIVEKVQKLTGVTAVVGFENLNVSALQKITFDQVPDAGLFQLVVGAATTGTILSSATASDVQTAIRALTGYSAVLVTGDFTNGFLIDFAASGANQTQSLIQVTGNTLTKSSNPVVVTVAYNRPGKSFEIVVQGGANADIAKTIYQSKPAGIQTYGTTTVNVTDDFGNLYPIKFSRPQEVTIYVTVVLVTDLLTATLPKFNPSSVADIRDDLVSIGNEVSIGGLIIGFGSDGLIGAFNNVPGITGYTLHFGTSPAPGGNANVQLLSNQIPVFESFNVVVSYT